MIQDLFFDFFELNQSVKTTQDGILFTDDKKNILDLLSQYGASPFGGFNKKLSQDIIEFFTEPNAVMCQPLSAPNADQLKKQLLCLCQMEGGIALLTQSGAETVELAIKLARTATGKKFTIALDGAFHGKTTAALQLTSNPEYAQYFGVDIDFVRRLKVGNLEELEADFDTLTADKRVNAVVVEVLQGEGGMVEIPSDWLHQLRELSQKAGILFIIDEIQTGLGRTGVMLASSEIGLKPDVVLLSKALGGGIVPIGACVAGPGIFPLDFTIFHSSTFSNNNFTTFVCSRALELIENILPYTKKAAKKLDLALCDLVTRNRDVFSHVSGRGLMRGLHLRETHDDQSLLANFQWHSGIRSYAMAAWMLNKQAILTMPCFSCPSCLRIQPPLNVTPDQIDRAIEGFEALAQLLRSPGTDLVLIGNVKQHDKAIPPRTVRSPTLNTTSRKFQFNMHPLHNWSFLDSLPEDIDVYGKSAKDQYINRVHKLSNIFSGFSAPTLSIPEFSLGGTRIHGRLLAINLTAHQMMKLTSHQRMSLQKQMFDSDKHYHANVMGMGGFTSIITSLAPRRLESGGVVTPGSSLTAYAAVNSALVEPPITEPLQFGIIGANGSVGGLCVQMLILAAIREKEINRVVLLLNPNNPDARWGLIRSLRRWVKSWFEASPSTTDDPIGWEGLKAIAQIFTRMVDSKNLAAVPEVFQTAVHQVIGRSLVEFTFSNDAQALRELDRLLLATNATRELDNLASCKSSIHLYDIGMPASVSADWAAKASITVYSAGLMRSQENWQFGHGNIVGLPTGVMLGCFAETLVLTATDPQAAPTGPAITLIQAQRIGQLALSVGLLPTLCPLVGMPHLIFPEIG